MGRPLSSKEHDQAIYDDNINMLTVCNQGEDFYCVHYE